MVYVKFESQQPKSLSQLVEELRKVQELEKNAIATLSDAIDAYSQQNPAQDYWEGFLSQVLSLFPEALVKKLAGETDTRETEDLRENVAALERELEAVRSQLGHWQSEATELKTRNAHLQKELEYWESEANKLAELKAQLAEWESKGNQLANELIESSTRDREDKDKEIEQLHQSLDELMKASAGVLEKNEQAFKEEKALLVQGFQERIDFFQKEIDRYRELEKNWGVQFAALQEEVKHHKEIAAQLNEELAKLNVDSLASQPEKKAETYCELVELAHNVAYLKVTETGEVLASYVGLRKVPGKKMKALANKWASYIAGIHGCKAEAREAVRMTGFDWEIKVTKIDMNRVRGLGKLNFSQYPDSEQDLENISELPSFFIEEVDQFDKTYPEYKVFLGDSDKHLWNAWKGTLTDKDGKIQRGWRTTKHRGTELVFPTLEDANSDAYARMNAEAENATPDSEPDF